jgi:hypothetical protein
MFKFKFLFYTSIYFIFLKHTQTEQRERERERERESVCIDYMVNDIQLICNVRLMLSMKRKSVIQCWASQNTNIIDSY